MAGPIELFPATHKTACSELLVRPRYNMPLGALCVPTLSQSYLYEVQVDVRALYPAGEVEGYRVGHLFVVES